MSHKPAPHAAPAHHHHAAPSHGAALPLADLLERPVAAPASPLGDLLARPVAQVDAASEAFAGLLAGTLGAGKRRRLVICNQCRLESCLYSRYEDE